MKNFRTLVEEQDPEWFVISDPHFYHRALSDFEPSRLQRFGGTPEEQAESMIEMWNLYCEEDSNVLLLGDFSFGTDAQNEELVERLNGKIWLVPGNHDHHTQVRRLEKRVSGRDLEVLEPLLEFDTRFSSKDHKLRVVCCHFPLFSWNKMRHGAVHLHGHCHGNIDRLNEGLRRIDIGYDSHSVGGILPLYPHRLFDVLRFVCRRPKFVESDHVESVRTQE